MEEWSVGVVELWPHSSITPKENWLMFRVLLLRAAFCLELAAALALSGPLAARAADLEVGKPAPDFALPDQNGKTHRLADYKGKTVVLAFYPKADTPGCTCEMQALRDVISQLQARSVVVFGASADTVEALKAFDQKYQLNFPLLADPEKKVIQAYGVLAQAGYADRVTFIIGPDGVIQGIDRNVNAQFAREDGKLISRHGAALALLLSDWEAKIGKPLPNFFVLDHHGKTVAAMPPGKKAAVFMFISKNCPISRAYDGRMREIASDPAYKDVAFLALNANQDEKAEEIKAHAEEQRFPFPVAQDRNNVLADRFGAMVTPEVWIVNAKGIAVYHGAIDDSQDAAGVKHRYLKDALDAVLADRTPPVAEAKAFGCTIKRVRKR